MKVRMEAKVTVKLEVEAEQKVGGEGEGSELGSPRESPHQLGPRA